MGKKKPTGFRDRIIDLRRVKASELVPNEKNPRTHGEHQAAAMRGILAEVGWVDGLIVRQLPDGRLKIINGHLRQGIAAEELVPVLVTDLSEAESDKVLLTFDPITELAGTNTAELEKLIARVKIETPDLQKMIDELAKQAGIGLKEVVEDEVPAVPKKPKTKPGQLFRLGDHRLLCGDSTSRDLVSRLMNGEPAGMIFTDPPYGHNNNNGDLIHNREAALGKKKTKSSAARPILNDGEEANAIVRGFFSIASEILVPGGCCCCCCCGGGGPDPQFARWSLWLDEAIPFKMCIVWDKGGLGMGWHYRRNWECILVAEKPGAACKWYGGNDVPNVIRDIGKIIPSADQHPTEKPVALPAFFIQLHSRTDEVVFEPFSGSGSTLIACEELGRRCYGMELDPAYCDVAIARWEKLTGRKAELVK